MKTRKTILTALAALTLLLGHGLAQDAEAKIRVRATLRTPHVGVVYSSGPAYRFERPAPLPTRYYRHVEVSRRDRRIAKRLASYTGVPRRELIHARRMGYSWNEIGRWLGVSKRVVKAAKSARRWERFLERERRQARQVRHRGYCDCDFCYHN